MRSLSTARRFLIAVACTSLLAAGGAAPATAGTAPADGTVVTMPDLYDFSPEEVNLALAEAELTLGRVHYAFDPTCDHIGLVMGQSVPAGADVAEGTRVHIVLGRLPVYPCPSDD
jgi:beta-lactam-binding protein with PASTA domain